MEKMFRSPRHHGFLQAYFAALTENREDDRVPKLRVPSEVLIEGAWADVKPAHVSRSKEKEKRLVDRRRARKFKLSMLE